MKHIIFSVLFVVIITSDSLGQKVKYKDLYVLLKAENYQDADPFLRIYLASEPDDPHANYSMGKMLQSYLTEGELLNGSARLGEIADSSLLYYRKSLALTDEKFVKKNDDDYYLDFRRRDLRTGKFEVKFSDVQFDIEERIAAVEKFKSDLVRLLSHFDKAQTFYKSAKAIYDSLVQKAPTINMLYFTSSTDDVNRMRDISAQYDSSLYHLSFYFDLMKGMGKAAVEQTLEKKQIENYPGDDVSTDFYAKEIVYLDFKSWAKPNVDIILRQIFPLKKRLIAFDERVQELHDQVVHDSLDKRDEVFQLATENVGRDLRDYEANTLPAAIFNYRISEINYHSAVNFWYKEVSDSLDIGLKLDVLQGFGKQLEGISKLLAKLKAADNPEQELMFNDYITARYNDSAGLKNFIAEQQASVALDSTHLWTWAQDLAELDKVAHWQSDSISLVIGISEENDNGRKYTTIELDTLDARTIGFYSWRKDTEGMALAFGVAPSSRYLDTLFVVPLNPVMSSSELPLPQYWVDTVGIGKRFWLVNSVEKQANDTYLIQAITTDLTLGVGWVKEFNVSILPVKSSFNMELKTIALLDENDNQVLLINEFGDQVVVEQNEGEEKDPEN